MYLMRENNAAIMDICKTPPRVKDPDDVKVVAIGYSHESPAYTKELMEEYPLFEESK